MDYRTRTSVKNILLTGATGVLGSRLLQEVLTATEANVYCLVRAQDHDAGLLRIKQVLSAYGPQNALASELWRVIPVLGDVSRRQLALSAETYEELKGSLDLVLHCAANVSLVAPYAKIAPSNVGGTHNVIELCLAGRIPLLFTSSFSLVGDKLYHPGTVLRETDLDIGQGFEDMEYERSKLEAEQAIHAAGQRGLDWVIVRPGNIWGDSVTGRYPLTQTKVRGLYYEMIRSLVESGLTFTSQEDFDVTPVDFVARASLYAIMNLHRTNRRTYHLTNPHPVVFDDIVQRLQAFGYSIRALDSGPYFDALKEGRVMRNGKSYRSTFTDLLALFVDGRDLKECAKFDTSAADALLEGTGIACHAANQQLMNRYLRYCIHAGMIPPPDQQGPPAQISSQTAIEGLLENLYDADLGNRTAVGT